MDYEGRTKIKDLEVGNSVCIFGTIKKGRLPHNFKKLAVLKINHRRWQRKYKYCYVLRGSKQKNAGTLQGSIPAGAGIIAYGTVKADKFSGLLTLDKPQIQVITSDFSEEEEEALYDNKITPVYPLCENLNAKSLTRAVYNAIEKFSGSIPGTFS